MLLFGGNPGGSDLERFSDLWRLDLQHDSHVITEVHNLIKICKYHYLLSQDKSSAACLYLRSLQHIGTDMKAQENFKNVLQVPQKMDFEVVKTEAQEFDRWVTGLVDLIPTQVYISKDMLPTKTEDEKNLSKSEKRKRRLDPEQCLTTSKLAFKNLEETQMDSNLAESNINPSDLRAKFDAKMAEIREKQNRTQADRTEEEQEAIREKRKREREKQKKMKQKTQKTIHENGIKSPTRNDQNANQNGKIIFNKFDLIQDPVEKAKLENQRKAPLQVRAKLAAKKEQRLAELEEENPEKAELIKEKKRWKDAETRLKGEKVRDDAKLLAKSVKRREQQKKASQKKWAERTEKLDAEKRKKQESRKKNLKERSMSKKGKSGPKGKKPGF